MTDTKLDPAAAKKTNILPFDTFWSWLVQHSNCIVRAGTPEVVLVDDTQFHWQLFAENSKTLLMQMLYGKRLVGEILIDPESIMGVEMHEAEQESEFVFDLISENGGEPMVLYYIILAHGYLAGDEDDSSVH